MSKQNFPTEIAPVNGHLRPEILPDETAQLLIPSPSELPEGVIPIDQARSAREKNDTPTVLVKGVGLGVQLYVEKSPEHIEDVSDTERGHRRFAISSRSDQPPGTRAHYKKPNTRLVTRRVDTLRRVNSKGRTKSHG